MEVKSNSPQETEEIANNLAKELVSGDVIALYGELGSGKTVFVKGLAKGLGIKKEVKSPTFVFEKRYLINLKGKNIFFHHLDLYRGDSISDLLSLGLEEILEADSIVVLEWADKIKDNLPKKRIDVTIKAENEKTRSISIKRTG